MKTFRVNQKDNQLLERVQNLSKALDDMQKTLQLYEQTSDLVVKVDADLMVSYASPSWKSVFRKSQENLVGHKLLEVIAPVDREVFNKAIQEILLSPESSLKIIEIRLLESGSRPRWMETRINSIPEISSFQGSMRIVFRNIDARKAATGLVNKILLVLGQNPTPIELLDPGGRVEYANAAYLNCFGWDIRDLLGRDTPSLQVTPQDQLGRNHYFMQAKTLGLWKGELSVIRKDGQEFPDRVTVYPLRNERGLLTDFAVFHEDLTEERRVSVELARQQNMLLLQSRQAQMGELLNMIAHQWRQPLTVISTLVGNIQLKMQLGGLDGDYLKVKLDKLGETVQFLSETIESFRNFYAPVKSAKKENLYEVIQKALEMLNPSLHKAHIQIENLPPPQNLFAKVFMGELLQVIIEIFNNARDALTDSPEKQKLIRVDWEVQDLSVNIIISNNAGAIPPEIIGNIFMPYFTTKEIGKGTGLGLYMAKIIIEEHHQGLLSVKCQDQWTKFIIQLNLLEAKE